jgi:hypothetical protein
MTLAIVMVLMATGLSCKEDARKLCPGVEQTNGALADCLKQHESELSGGCKESRSRVREKRPSRIREPCKGDVEKFCRGFQNGDVAPCLKQHESQLSVACREQGGEIIGRQERGIPAVQDACAGDAARFCPGVEVGGGRMARCLKRHRTELSPPCVSAFAEIRQDR